MKKLVYFLKKGSGKDSILFDPILDFLDLRSDHDPQKEDLDPKGSRSDHDRQYSAIVPITTAYSNFKYKNHNTFSQRIYRTTFAHHGWSIWMNANNSWRFNNFF